MLDSVQRVYCRDLPSPECGVKDWLTRCGSSLLESGSSSNKSALWGVMWDLERWGFDGGKGSRDWLAESAGLREAAPSRHSLKGRACLGATTSPPVPHSQLASSAVDSRVTNNQTFQTGSPVVSDERTRRLSRFFYGLDCVLSTTPRRLLTRLLCPSSIRSDQGEERSATPSWMDGYGGKRKTLGAWCVQSPRRLSVTLPRR